MKRYTLKVIEKHTGFVEVEAATVEDARNMAQDEINNGMVNWNDIELASVTVKTDAHSCNNVLVVATTGNIKSNVATSAPITMTICRELTISMAGSPTKVTFDIRITPEELKNAFDIQEKLYDLESIKNQLSSVLEESEFSNVEYETVVSDEKLMEEMWHRYTNLENCNLDCWNNMDDAIRSVLREEFLSETTSEVVS